MRTYFQEGVLGTKTHQHVLPRFRGSVGGVLSNLYLGWSSYPLQENSARYIENRETIEQTRTDLREGYIGGENLQGYRPCSRRTMGGPLPIKALSGWMILTRPVNFSP